LEPKARARHWLEKRPSPLVGAWIGKKKKKKKKGVGSKGADTEDRIKPEQSTLTEAERDQRLQRTTKGESWIDQRSSRGPKQECSRDSTTVFKRQHDSARVVNRQWSIEVSNLPHP
jgi:hypothetical protein